MHTFRLMVHQEISKDFWRSNEDIAYKYNKTPRQRFIITWLNFPLLLPVFKEIYGHLKLYKKKKYFEIVLKRKVNLISVRQITVQSRMRDILHVWCTLLG